MHCRGEQCSPVPICHVRSFPEKALLRWVGGRTLFAPTVSTTGKMVLPNSARTVCARQPVKKVPCRGAQCARVPICHVRSFPEKALLRQVGGRTLFAPTVSTTGKRLLMPRKRRLAGYPRNAARVWWSTSAPAIQPQQPQADGNVERDPEIKNSRHRLQVPAVLQREAQRLPWRGAVTEGD